MESIFQHQGKPMMFLFNQGRNGEFLFLSSAKGVAERAMNQNKGRCS